MRGSLYSASGVFRSMGNILSDTLGLLLRLGEGVCSTGLIMSYLLRLISRWKRVALLNLVIPAIACALSIFIPESPVFLAKNGKDEAAKKSLRRLISNVDRLGQVIWQKTTCLVRCLHVSGVM